jgi:hypothetical protein
MGVTNPRRLLSLPITLAFGAVLGVTPLPIARVDAEPCHATDPADFNGDGLGDLAVGAPYATAGGTARAGAVGVRYGDRRAIPDGEVTWLSQGTAGVHEAAERGDGFGAALAMGDFNGDRCGDLAVGVPDEVLGRGRMGADGNGAVQVFMGSPLGLRAGSALTVRTLGRAYGTDRFGAALAAADLDGDRDDELVVGAPGLAGSGAVAVLGMGRQGLGGSRLIEQSTPWVGQRAAQTDDFGAVLAVGDFSGDGRPEIAVGVPGDGERSAGSVTVLDVRARTARSLAQAGRGLSGDPEIADRFGAALAAGDFDNDGGDDLAIGVPGEDLNTMPATAGFGEGAVHVLNGPSLAERAPMWFLEAGGSVGRYDHFGSALAAGDLDGDGVADLAVGAPGRGQVQVLPGRAGTGLPAAGDEGAGTVFTSRLGSTAEFGWALTSRRYGRGKASDLLIGAPGAYGFGGVVAVLPGSRRLRGGVTNTVISWPGGGLTGYALG